MSSPHIQQTGNTSQQIAATVTTTLQRIPPLWPLTHFVAVNPFLGLDDHDHAATAQRLARIAGARLTLPRSTYAQHIADGTICDADLEAAVAAHPQLPGLPHDAVALRAAARRSPEVCDEAMPTVATVAARNSGRNWPAIARDRIADWAAAHFDQGQASWSSPWQQERPWHAWIAEATIDPTPERLGLPGFRSAMAELPADPQAALVQLVKALDIPDAALEWYLHAVLLRVDGWAGHARYRAWQAELQEGEEHSLHDLLVISLAWEWAFLRLMPELQSAWEQALTSMPELVDASVLSERRIDLMLHSAFEHSWYRRTLEPLHQQRSEAHVVVNQRPAVQAAFCIDVRSEVFRRALETVAPSVTTIGFAGFFGMPIEYVPIGHERGGARCPALIPPAFSVHEHLDDEHADDQHEPPATTRQRQRRLRRAWGSFASAAGSTFGYVEAFGLGYAAKLVRSSLGHGRPTPHPDTADLDACLHEHRAPDVPAAQLPLADRVALAQGAIAGLSLGREPAPLVLLVGHGSTSVNNPHASGLDCGACGGHSGDANARIAAAVLNDPEVRQALTEEGQSLPADTHFIAGLHDTTTDELRILDLHLVPERHQDACAALTQQLHEAGTLARLERAPALAVKNDDQCHQAIQARSRDWAQLRPEWGLAGCGAFIVAPRHRTAGVDLGGRSFLHSYDWQQDADFAVLELIMTAPLIVTTWINLQYYASAVDNEHFGAGDKTLHNVVGGIGVLEGGGGDLRPGLPLQSVHDGTKLIHEPVRLTAVIEAPTEAMDAIIGKHEHLQRLLINGWLHLVAMDGSGVINRRFHGIGDWQKVHLQSSKAAGELRPAC